MGELVTLLSSIIGGACAIAGGSWVSKKQYLAQERQAASVLYYDLKSIERYLKNERSSVNIRYFSEWQSVVASCTFLKPDEVMQIYQIYDLVYNYDYYYKLKEEQGTVVKEDISEYMELKNCMFRLSSSKNELNMCEYNPGYSRLLDELKENQYSK